VPWPRRNLILETERAGNAATLRTTYGTETSNYRNAFGECVSRKAGENDTD